MLVYIQRVYVRKSRAVADYFSYRPLDLVVTQLCTLYINQLYTQYDIFIVFCKYYNMSTNTNVELCVVLSRVSYDLFHNSSAGHMSTQKCTNGISGPYVLYYHTVHYNKDMHKLYFNFVLICCKSCRKAIAVACCTICQQSRFGIRLNES